MKRLLMLLALLCLPLLASSCVRLSNQQYYERAQLYLGAEDYARAEELFRQLGEYRDSADYALYASALSALADGDYALARTNLEQLDGFKSAGRYLRRIDALEYEAEGSLEKALTAYELLGSFAGSDEDAARMRVAIPEQAISKARSLMAKGDYAAARDLLQTLDGYGRSTELIQGCTDALNKADYARADALCRDGDHLAAMRAFLIMGDALDAAERAAQCRSSLLKGLQTAAETVTVTDAHTLIETCEAIGDEAADELAAALRERFGANISLIAAADSRPYVLLGEYPVGESGMESALVWRVIGLNGTEATLLCESVIDASPVATGSDLMLTEAEQAALTGSSLPSAADLISLTDLACAATPYAVAQGVTQEDGFALYWLRDSLESGVHPVVSSSGNLTIPVGEDTPGLRPMVTLSLDAYVFTTGDGTRENPFR